ncbi:MAG: hypothetical protein WC670_09340 [Pseudolabrys sp.]|jgi:hypothetical protein
MSPFKITALVLAAAALTGGSAQAQWYSSVRSQPPLYPYAPQPGIAPSAPYAVEVAPGTYVIQRPDGSRETTRSRHVRRPAPAPAARASRTRNDPVLIDELRKRAAVKPHGTVNTTKVVHEKPKVVETTRYVDDPPRVVERYTVVDDGNGEKKVVVEPQAAGRSLGTKHNRHEKNEKRVIQADAEITILGPDRMTIQLYRKGERGKAGARLN